MNPEKQRNKIALKMALVIFSNIKYAKMYAKSTPTSAEANEKILSDIFKFADAFIKKSAPSEVKPDHVDESHREKCPECGKRAIELYGIGPKRMCHDCIPF